MFSFSSSALVYNSFYSSLILKIVTWLIQSPGTESFIIILQFLLSHHLRLDQIIYTRPVHHHTFAKFLVLANIFSAVKQPCGGTVYHLYFLLSLVTYILFMNVYLLIIFPVVVLCMCIKCKINFVIVLCMYALCGVLLYVCLCQGGMAMADWWSKN